MDRNNTAFFALGQPVVSDVPSGDINEETSSLVGGTILRIAIVVAVMALVVGALIWALRENEEDEEKNDDIRRRKALRKQQVREFYQDAERTERFLQWLRLV